MSKNQATTRDLGGQRLRPRLGLPAMTMNSTTSRSQSTRFSRGNSAP
jgi:hypothetical protein